MIILGGGLAGIGEPCAGGGSRCVAQFTMARFAPGPRVVLTALGEDAVPVGALEIGEVWNDWNDGILDLMPDEVRLEKTGAIWCDLVRLLVRLMFWSELGRVGSSLGSR